MMLSVRRDICRGPTVSDTTISSSRRYRLTGSAEFDRVFKRSRRSADRLFTVLYCDNDLGYPRLGLAMAKRNVRLAVQRNRLKRIIRESFRASRLRLPPCDVVVIARRPAGQAANPELHASLQQHWRKLSQQTGEQPRKH